MAKQNKIRWRESDKQELKKAVRNFNSKIKRIEKKTPSRKGELPVKVSYKDLKNNIKSRAEFNRTLESLSKFSKRGMERSATLDNGITVTKWEEKELQHSVDKFNKKLNFHKKRYKGNAPYLPNNKTYEQVINQIDDVQELRRMTQSLYDFLNSDSTNLIKSNRSAIMTKWEMAERKANEEKYNEIKRKEREKIEKEPVKVGGVPQDATRATMGTTKENSLKESHKNFMNMSQKEWDLFRNMMDNVLNKTYRNEKKEIMRENYIKGLREANFLEYDENLEKYIRGIDVDDFIANVETDETATFVFYKDPQEWEVRAEYILETWRTLYNQKVGK